MNKRRFSLFLMIFALPALIHCSATATRRSMGETLDDAVITNKLKTKFMKDKTVKAFQIDIDTWKGVVSLRGKVDSQNQIYKAIEMAERQTGVKEVKSYLVIRNTAPAESPSGKEGPVVEEKDIEPDKPDNFVDEGSPQVTPE